MVHLFPYRGLNRSYIGPWGPHKGLFSPILDQIKVLFGLKALMDTLLDPINVLIRVLKGPKGPKRPFIRTQMV